MNLFKLELNELKNQLLQNFLEKEKYIQLESLTDNYNFYDLLYKYVKSKTDLIILIKNHLKNDKNSILKLNSINDIDDNILINDINEFIKETNDILHVYEILNVIFTFYRNRSSKFNIEYIFATLIKNLD